MAGGVVVVRIAVGQFVGTGCGVTGSGIEGEREALQVGVGWGCGGGQVEFEGLGFCGVRGEMRGSLHYGGKVRRLRSG